MPEKHIFVIYCMQYYHCITKSFTSIHRTDSGTAKVKSIAQARGLNSDNILKNVIVAKTYTTRKLEYCIESTQSKIKTERGVKLLIVDSMTHLYKTEFTERSQLPERQAKMSKYLHILLRLAHMNCVAVVITNQVHSNPNSNSEADKQNQ